MTFFKFFYDRFIARAKSIEECLKKKQEIKDLNTYVEKLIKHIYREFNINNISLRIIIILQIIFLREKKS